MLKVVVFDGGYGGELFADYLESELPVVEVIRVIDWRNADKLLAHPKTARKVAKQALRPYIGRVDLIIFANHLLSATSLKYFQHKYPNQKFIGINLERPSSFIKHDVLILTTKAVTKTINYHCFRLRIKRKTKSISLDHWLAKIDNGELSPIEIKETIAHSLIKSHNFFPKEIILGCAHFSDIKTELDNSFKQHIKIYDGFPDAVNKIYRALNLRGGTGRRKK